MLGKFRKHINKKKGVEHADREMGLVEAGLMAAIGFLMETVDDLESWGAE